MGGLEGVCKADRKRVKEAEEGQKAPFLGATKVVVVASGIKIRVVII